MAQDELVIMVYKGDSQALVRSERMPSGQRYEYSASEGYNTLFAHPDDVKELEKIGFQRIKAEPVEQPAPDATQEDVTPTRESRKK